MSSRANRTAQIIEAQIATVLAKRALCSFSHAIARFISRRQKAWRSEAGFGSGRSATPTRILAANFLREGKKAEWLVHRNRRLRTLTMNKANSI
jgi:hypothetical protein